MPLLRGGRGAVVIDEKKKLQAAENILADMVCESCGDATKPTKFVADPFDEEVNNKVVMRHFCDKCYTDRKEDI